MSKRAEEKAIDAWAIYEYREHPKGLYHTCFVDGYKEGYELAEKDLALTWEDIKLINRILWDLHLEGWPCDSETQDEARFKEVLKRFQEVKK